MINEIKDYFKNSRDKKKSITQAWAEYEAGKLYNEQLGAYRELDQNYRFYSGDHWRGLQSSGHPTPVFNVLKRTVDFKISTIASEPITMRYTAWDEKENPFIEVLNGHLQNLWESLKMDQFFNECIEDAAISGTAAAFVYWDEEKEAGESEGYEMIKDEAGEQLYNYDGTAQERPVPIEGDICIDKISITQVFFAEPTDPRVNKNGKANQEYILLVGRDSVRNLTREAKENDGDPDMVSADEDVTYTPGDDAKTELVTAKKATYIIKMFYNPDTGTIWSSKYTQHAVIIPPYDTELTLYPVAIFRWSKKKGTYHGKSEIQEMIPNQVVVNKLHAIMTRWTIDNAWGKIIYDGTRVRNWTNSVGKAIRVDGPVNDAVQMVLPAQINPIVVQLFDRTIDRTFECMGVNDVILGNVRPENAAAIIAIQQTSSVPLELPKQAYHQFVEEIGLIIKDFIKTRYTVPRKVKYMENDERKQGLLDIEDMPKDTAVRIDVGASTHWSQLTSVETIMNMLQNGWMTLPQALDRMAPGYIPKQEQLKKEVEQDPPPAMAQALMTVMQLQQQAQAAQQPPQPQGAPPPQGAPAPQGGGMPPQQPAMEPPQQMSQVQEVTDYFHSLPINLQERIKQLPPEEQANALMQMMTTR